MTTIHPVVDEDLGNSAYVVELGDGRAMAVDSARDPTPYLGLARWRWLQIACAAETHLHVDFLTGSRELAGAAGAQVLAPRASRLGFTHRGLADGEEVDLGGLTLRVLGHARARPRACQLPAPGRPAATGPVQRRGAAGRHRGPHRPGRPGAHRAPGPGRLPVPAPAAPVVARRARRVPDPWRRLLLRRPGRGRAHDHHRRQAPPQPAPGRPDEDAYVAQPLAGFGSYPPYFLRLRARNRVQPELLGRDWKVLPLLSTGQVQRHLPGGGMVIDARPITAFAAGHLPGAVAVELGALAGDRVLAQLPEGPVTVMCAHGARAMTAASLLERSGHKELRVVHGGPRDWQRATGQALARS
jgi:hydroxyacylglutathione hydrolase